jgi:hypothetical protein
MRPDAHDSPVTRRVNGLSIRFSRLEVPIVYWSIASGLCALLNRPKETISTSGSECGGTRSNLLYLRPGVMLDGVQWLDGFF